MVVGKLYGIKWNFASLIRSRTDKEWISVKSKVVMLDHLVMISLERLPKQSPPVTPARKQQEMELHMESVEKDWKLEN